MKENIKTVTKILNLLNSGFLLALERNHNRRKRLSEECDEIWYSIDRRQLYQILERLKLKNIITIIKAADGVEKIKLTRRGTAYALQKKLQTISLKKEKRWDGKWRMVLFDIPEVKRKLRNALRVHLKKMGFLEFQKSVFIYPFSCRDEINFVVNVLGLSEYVYYVESTVSSDAVLRKHFKI